MTLRFSPTHEISFLEPGAEGYALTFDTRDGRLGRSGRCPQRARGRAALLRLAWLRHRVSAPVDGQRGRGWRRARHRGGARDPGQPAGRARRTRDPARALMSHGE